MFTFTRRLKSSNYKSHWNILVLFQYVSWKNVWFCFNSIVWVPLVIKLKNCDFESHWNNLMFLIKKDLVSALNMSHGKMSDFVSFPLFGFTLVTKLRSSDFENHWNILIFFWLKKICCQIWMCPVKQCLIWFKLRCLSKILAIILLKLKIVNIFRFKNLLSDQNLSHFFWSYLYFLALL